jgi:KaiC/GvpD/RAD55 family RecA-like ATPase
MHSPQDVHAILGLFDGEIGLEERKTSRGSKKILKINRLYNQKYLTNELTLERDDLILSSKLSKQKYLSTGYYELDKVLFGGIPETYAVVLNAPFCDERDLLIKNFLDEGLEKGETVLYLSTEITEMKKQAEEFQSQFHLFLCNPQADMLIKDATNIYKLRNGVMSLTEINIALSNVIRKLAKSKSNNPRICINIVSDVLLQHQVITTKNWLIGLISEFRSKGFTTLAVMNSLMHSSQDVQAILGLFDGEISLIEKKTPRGTQKILRINRMFNQEYLSDEFQIKKGESK